MPCESWGFPVWLVGMLALLGPVWTLDMLTLIFPCGSFPSLLTRLWCSILSPMLEEDPLHISGFSLHVDLSSLILCLQILASLIFLNSQLHFLKLGCPLDSAWFSVPVLQHGNSFKVVCWEHIGFTSCVSHVSGLNVLHYLISRVLQTIALYILSSLHLFTWTLLPVTPS